MKTVKNLLIAIVLLLAVNNSTFATEANIKVIGDKSFVLSIETPISALTISLVDKNNIQLYAQNVNTVNTEYKKKFNLSSLPNGIYTLKVEDVVKVTTLLVKIENDKIFSNEITKEATLKPSVYVKGENLLVSGLATSTNPINLNIYNKNEELAYEAILVDESVKNRMYKFLYSGVYTIYLTKNGETYSYDIHVKVDPKTKEQIISVE